MKKILSLVLVLFMLLPALIACGGGDNGGATTNPNLDTSAGNYVSKLPNKDWEGDSFRVIGLYNEGAPAKTNFEVYSEGITGDLVGDAVWERNEILRQRYNFTISFDHEEEHINEKMLGFMESQDDMYDLCLFRARYILEFAKNGYLKDLNSTPYLDFDHPTWDKSVNEQLTINGRMFFSTSNFMLQNKARMGLLFYNREMARSQGIVGEGEYIEKEYVDANKWTLDNFSQMIKLQGYDLGGDGVAGGIDDHYGLATGDWHQFTYFCIGAGFSFSGNDGGTIYINPADSLMEKIASKAAVFALDKTLTLYPESVVPYDYSMPTRAFCEERAMFLSAYVGTCSTLGQEAHFEYGVLPFPKYESAQDRYYSVCMGDYWGTTFAIPFTVTNMEKAGFMLEAISEASHTTTFPTFIRDKVQLQDAYDEVSAEKLELIFDSQHIDLAATFDPANIVAFMGEDVVSKGRITIFKRNYDAKYDSAQEIFDEIMTAYGELR